MILKIRSPIILTHVLPRRAKRKSVIKDRLRLIRTPDERFRRVLYRTLAVSLVAFLVLVFATSAFQLGYRSRLALADPRPRGSQPDKDTIVREVVTLDEEIKDTTARIDELEGESAELEAGIDSTNAEIDSKRERLSRKRKVLALRIRTMYVNGKSTNLDMLLSASDLSDFLARSEYVEKVTDKDSELIDGVKLESQRLEQSLEELKAKKSEIDFTARELQGRQQRLEQSRSARQELLSETGEARQSVVQESEKVKSKIDELNPLTLNPRATPGDS